MLFPTVREGKCFCSPECEALYRDPEILSKVELWSSPVWCGSVPAIIAGDYAADLRLSGLVPALVLGISMDQ